MRQGVLVFLAGVFFGTPLVATAGDVNMQVHVSGIRFGATINVVALRPATPAESALLGLHLISCARGHSKVPARCGTFGVYEDRASRSGRVISLAVVVLKAKYPTRRAIALVAGGPGQSAVAFADPIADGAFAQALSVLRDRYNILLVDSRGMGGSHAFNCAFVQPENPAPYLRQLWPDKLVGACRIKSLATSNPNLYNTNNAVDDLDGLRAALGYPKLVLDGGSYGTFFSMVYIRRHPNRVESAILDGMFAPHFVPFPGSPDGAQAALDDLIAKCRRDHICHSHFPAFVQHFNAVMQRFVRSAVPVSIRNAATKRFETIPLSKEVLVDRLRQAMYDPQNAATIPYAVERAYRSDYIPLGDLVNGMSLALAGALDGGAFLSYTCADEMPFIDERAIKAAAARSFAGDLRFRAQQRACSIWKVRPMPRSFNDPVRTALPILIVTGSDDPTTPPRAAREALPFLPNARQVVVRGAGHTTETPCTDRLMVKFVRATSAKGLDISQCTELFKQPPFATTFVP